MSLNYYFQSDDGFFSLLEGDCMTILPTLRPETVDVIITDPPYFLSNDGVTCVAGKMVSVNKGKWDKNPDIKSIHKFNTEWLSACQKLLKPNGTIWIFGSQHNIFSVGMALKELEFKVLNNITWEKTSPPPNLACRTFTHSTENIIWAAKNSKSKYAFNYADMKKANGGKQMKDVWKLSTAGAKEKTAGKHPTQKPEKLVERLILASTKEHDLILDPFTGSSTTGIVAHRLNRQFVGIDKEPDYLKLSKKRFGP